MRDKQKNLFLQGVAILSFTAFLSKLLGAIYRIPFQNITGDLGLAVYNKVYPLYSMVLILATAGFPVAISKLVAEEVAQGNHFEAKRILRVSVYMLSISGLILFLFLYLGSSTIAELMGNSKLTLAVKSVSFALLVVPVMAALRGYFQGYQNMNPTAYSQVIEQTVRVITILVLAYILIKDPNYGVYYAGAGAVFGAFTGAVAGFIVLMIFWRKFKKNNSIRINNKDFLHEKKSLVQIVKNIFYYSIPIAIGSLIFPFFGVVDSFSISNLLQMNGFAIQEAENLFGVYTRGQPLVQFATFFAPSFSLALVPAISDALIKNQHKKIQEYIGSALRFTLLIGLPASTGLALLAGPINIFFYKDSMGTLALAIMSFTVIFSALVIVSTGILNGLGNTMLPAKYLLFGVLVKVILNLVLIPIITIHGAALATLIAYGVSTIFNVLAIRSEYELGIRLSFLSKNMMSVAIMGIIVIGTEWLTHFLLLDFVGSTRFLMFIITLTSIITGIISYVIGLLLTGTIRKNDLMDLPKYGDRLLRLLGRLKLMKYVKD